METKETIKILRETNKWRRGKGKKYEAPNTMPFTPSEVGLAIDDAIAKLNAYSKVCCIIASANKVEDVSSH